jgi:SAM-dependent methyltransferase
MDDDRVSAEAWDRHWRSAAGDRAARPDRGLRGFLVRRGDFSRLILSMLVEAGAARPGTLLLEAGCGSAKNLGALARRGVECVGLDTSARACASASSAGCRAVRGSVTELPFASGTFDAATATGVIDQLGPGGVGPAVREMARVVRPGGVLVLINNSAYSRVHSFVMERLIARGEWPWGPKAALASLRSEALAAAPGTVVEESGRGWLLQWRFPVYLLPSRGPWRALYGGALLLLNWILWPLNRLPGMVLVTVLRKPADAGGGKAGN